MVGLRAALQVESAKPRTINNSEVSSLKLGVPLA